MIQAREGADRNSITAILYSYDMQAGSYIDQLQDPSARALKERLGQDLAALLDELAPESILEAGTGEATSLVPVLQQMKRRPDRVLEFDISLSRLLYARKYRRTRAGRRHALYRRS